MNVYGQLLIRSALVLVLIQTGGGRDQQGEWYIIYYVLLTNSYCSVFCCFALGLFVCVSCGCTYITSKYIIHIFCHVSQLRLSMVWDNSKGNSYSSSLFDCLFCFKLWSIMLVMIFTNQTTFIRCSSLETLDLACGCEVLLKNMMPAAFWTPLVDVINNVTKFFGINVRKHLNLKWFISYLFNVVFLCSPRCSIKSSRSFKFQQKPFKPRCFGVHPRSFRPEFFGAMFHLWIATGWGRCRHKGMMNKSMMKGMKPCTSSSHDLQGFFASQVVQDFFHQQYERDDINLGMRE